jgi:hypothetical protein
LRRPAIRTANEDQTMYHEIYIIDGMMCVLREHFAACK